jgi:hypothetical protein
MSEAAQIAYCGLYCGDCIIRRGRIGSLSEDLLQVMRTAEFQKLSTGLPKIAPEQFMALSKSDDCCRVLETMSHLHCEGSCKEGGGTAGCRIRECCQTKKIAGCWECGEFEDCQTLAWLQPVNGVAHVLNLRKIRDEGIADFLAGVKHW